MYRRLVVSKAGKTLFMVCTHIDDFKIACDDKSDLEPFLSVCEAWLPCVRRPPEMFVGFRTEYDRSKGIMTESKKDSVVELLERFGMSDCRSCSTPAAPGTKLEKNPRQCTDLNVLEFMFEELVGSLRWLSRGDYPEISYAVNHLSAHMTNLNSTNVTPGKRILRYLKGKVDQVITIRRNKTGELKLRCATDADFNRELYHTSTIN